MSRVFFAHDVSLDRDVVVKVLPPEMVADVSVERFEREIQVAARLQHPHIVPVLTAGQSGGLPYFIMPYIDGESLRQRLQRGGELPVPEAVRILRDVATALEHAHRHSVAHRDIKPENVLITGGTAVVTDFGVAKALAASATDSHTALTSVGIALGTPAYMAPEQAAADPSTDHRADIYAWGVLAYEMLTGAPPFSARPPHAMFAAHMTEAVVPLQERRAGVPQSLADIVMRSLAKRPADRPQSATEVIQALDAMVATGVSTPAPMAVRTRGYSRYRIPIVSAGVLALLIPVALWLGRGHKPESPAATEVKSVAVLPFMSAGGADDYFAEGMAEELSTALGRVPGLQVASRSSTFAVRGESVDVRSVGKRLRVDAVLEGRVRRAGDRLRVTAQLTDAATGLSLWSDAFEREVRDVFSVQDEIARAIAGALQVRLAGNARAAQQGTADLEAYDLYLRGRYHWHRRGAENLRTAISLFEQAIERDPNFGRAHAGLAIAGVLLPEYSDRAPEGLEERAVRSAERALSIDDKLAEAHAAIGLANVHEWRWEEAERAYQAALSADPRYGTAHQWYGELLYHLGRVEESVQHLRMARELDPLAAITAGALAYALHVARRADEAVEEARRGVELAPDLGLIYRVLAFAHLQAGNRDSAYAAITRAMLLDPEMPARRGQLVYVAAKAGHVDRAREEFERLRRRGGARQPYALAWGHLGLGDVDSAAAAFDRAVDARDPLLSSYSFLADPVFEPLLGNPRFQRVLQRMGLKRR